MKSSFQLLKYITVYFYFQRGVLRYRYIWLSHTSEPIAEIGSYNNNKRVS